MKFIMTSTTYVHNRKFRAGASMIKYKRELCFLGTCKPGQRSAYLKQAPAGLIHAVGNVAKILLEGDLHLTESQRQKLRKQRENLITLAAHGASVQKKQKILISQRGGSLLVAIWQVIKPLVSSYGQGIATLPSPSDFPIISSCVHR